MDTLFLLLVIAIAYGIFTLMCLADVFLNPNDDELQDWE
jgi:hypothetical protein